MHISPSGKKYIGITSQVPKYRWKNGNGYEHNPHLWSAIQKYGWDSFEHIILLQGIIYEQASTIEKYLIDVYKTKDKNFGYNMTDGGEGTLGWAPSEETKKKISESKKGKKMPDGFGDKLRKAWSENGHPMEGTHRLESTKEILSKKAKDRLADPTNHPMFGKNQSEETKEKIRNGAIERLKDPTNHPNYGKHINVGINHGRIRPIFCIEMQRIFWGASEANKEYGFNISCISECINGNKSSTGKHPETNEKLHWLSADDAIKEGYITAHDLDNYLSSIKQRIN